MSLIGAFSLISLNSEILMTEISGYATGGIVIAGTWSGTLTISASVDGVSFSNIVTQPIGGGAFSSSITSNGSYLISLAGFFAVKVTMTSFTSGAAEVKIYGIKQLLFGKAASAIAGAVDGSLIGNVSDALKVETDPVSSYANITGNGTTTVKSGAGRLRGVLIGNDNTGGDVVIYDNTAGSGTKITSIQLGTPSGGLLSTTGLKGPVYLPLNTTFSTGLTIVTSGSSNNNITVVYR